MIQQSTQTRIFIFEISVEGSPGTIGSVANILYAYLMIRFFFHQIE